MYYLFCHYSQQKKIGTHHLGKMGYQKGCASKGWSYGVGNVVMHIVYLLFFGNIRRAG